VAGGPRIEGSAGGRLRLMAASPFCRSGVLRTTLPRGFAQHVGEAEARVLRWWLRALGAQWSGDRGFLNFARAVCARKPWKLLRARDLRFASRGGVPHRAGETRWFCTVRDGDCSVIPASARFDGGRYSMDLCSLISVFRSWATHSRQLDVRWFCPQLFVLGSRHGIGYGCTVAQDGR
jgi:hypothetical protein